MFISTAWAQGAGGGGGDFLGALLPIVLIFGVFYFLLIRPQQKKMKQHQEMIGNVRRGDKIVTGGGIYGTVTKVVNDQEAMVEIADGVRVRIARATISSVLSKTEPARGDAKSGQGAAGQGAANDGTAKPAGLLDKIMGRK